MQPLVSIVIPTYNYGHFVEEAVDSALAQTYSPVETIVVDDGSTDDTQQRLQRYGDRVRVIVQQNAGLSAARNTGIKAANGEFVALLDSDDAFHPQKIERQTAAFRAFPALGLVGSLTSHADLDVCGRFPDETPKIQRFTIDDLVLLTRITPSTAMIRRDVFDAVGLFDESLRSVEDRDFWIRVADRFEVGRVEERLVWYRVTTSSMSRNAEKMERYEHAVLQKAFALPQLRSRRRLQSMATGRAALTAAYMYFDSGDYSKALSRIGRSVCHWPLPFARRDVNAFLARPRFAFAVLRRMVASKLQRQRG